MPQRGQCMKLQEAEVQARLQKVKETINVDDGRKDARREHR